MAQSDEALAMMTCARCGGFSGPEVLCARCEKEAVDDEGYGFLETERPMTPDERRGEIVRFLSWLTDNASVDAILLADASGGGRLRQVLDEDEFVVLVQEWEQAEEDAACAAAEHAYERD